MSMNTLRENTNMLNHSTNTGSSSPDFDTSLNLSTGSPNMSANRIGNAVGTGPNTGNTTGNTLINGKPKTPLRKDELEKIAKQLKKKLSKASITAKQTLSPTNLKTPSNNASSVLSKASPLKYHMLRKNKFDLSPTKNTNILSSSPQLYSPNGKSPTQMKTSSASYFLSSSPLRGTPLSASRPAGGVNNNNHQHGNRAFHHDMDLADSPTKQQRNPKPSSLINNTTPHISLQHVEDEPSPNTTPKALATALKPSPALTTSSTLSNPNSTKKLSRDDDIEEHEDEDNLQVTPTLPRKQLQSTNQLLKTPTQSKQHSNNGGAYNDDEGADLLMYLATSPSPAKPFYGNNSNANNTPRSRDSLLHFNNNSSQPTISTSAPNSAGSSTISHKPGSSASGSAGSSSSFSNGNNGFIAPPPPPPLTPKRHINTAASMRTPQNRLTPSINLFNTAISNNNNNVSGHQLPSSGLTLTPAGFNMSDYVFFTPSPGAANIHHGSNTGGGGNGNSSLGILNNKTFLKTPDFNTMMSGYGVLASGGGGLGGVGVTGGTSANDHTNDPGADATTSETSSNATDASQNGKHAVDGKMINFDKDGLFGHGSHADNGKE